MVEVTPQQVVRAIKERISRSGQVNIREIAAKFNLPSSLIELVISEDRELRGYRLRKSNTDPNIYNTGSGRLREELGVNTTRVAPLNFFSSNYEALRGGLLNPSTALRFEPQPQPKPKPKVMPKPKVTMESVVIESEKIEQIRSAISQIKNSKLIFDKWGFSEVFEKGTAITLLFYGVPGTGKTLMAEAIASELGYELKVYGTAEIQSSEPGGAERAIKKIFEEASKLIGSKKQQVILLDECDSLLSSREKMGAIMAAQVNTLLQEIEKYAGVVIFTTNRLGKLDPALERRIAAKIQFAFPTESMREQIWKRLIPKKAPIGKSVDFKKLSRFPIAGGNIKNVVLNAARLAAYKGCSQIDAEHFKSALEKELLAIESFELFEKNDNGYPAEDIGVSDGMGANKLQLTEGRKTNVPHDRSD